jgi:Retrotransposon gag protein/Zinc knuckle
MAQNLQALLAQLEANPLPANANNVQLRAHQALLTEIIMAQGALLVAGGGVAQGGGAPGAVGMMPAPRGVEVQHYDGKSEIREWLAHMDDFFDLYPHVEKVKFAGFHLKPKVSTQWKARAKKLIEDGQDPTSWEVFKTAMAGLYGPADPSEKARKELSKLQQGKMSAEAFQKKFVETASRISENPLSENDLSGKFWDALDPELKVLMRTANQGKKPESLQKMYELSVSLDQDLKELKEVQRSGEDQKRIHSRQRKDGDSLGKHQRQDSSKRKGGNSGNGKFPHKKQRLSRAAQAMRGLPPLDPQKKKALEDKKLCFICEQPGHIARQCPKGGKNNGQKGGNSESTKQSN